MRRIDSTHNPIVKTLRRLSRSRKRESRYLIEGRKLVGEALAAGVPIEVIVHRRGLVLEDALPSGPISKAVQVVELEPKAFAAITTQATPEGVLALARRPDARALPATGVVAVAAGIQDPGNLGAVARVVEASGASALALLPGTTDPFSPKALRGAMGSLFRVPVVDIADASDLDAFHTVALVHAGGVDFRRFDWAQPVAIFLGAESRGLSAELVKRCDHRVSIPMHGLVDSLNVATAAALALFEAAARGDRRVPIAPC